MCPINITPHIEVGQIVRVWAGEVLDTKITSQGSQLSGAEVKFHRRKVRGDCDPLCLDQTTWKEDAHTISFRAAWLALW